MTGEQKPTSTGGGGSGLTLYAHLIGASNGSVPGQISSAPVMYNQSNEQQEQLNEAAPAKSTDFTKQIFQQRSKRPQHATKPKGAPKVPGFAHTSSATGASSSPDKGAPAIQPVTAVGPVNTTTAADWMSREEDDMEYLENDRYKPSRKNKKKKKKQEDHAIEIDWDEPYDPFQPSDYASYLESQEYREAEDEWFEKLRSHRRPSPGPKQGTNLDRAEAYAQRNQNFAPPPNLNDDVVMADEPALRGASGMAAMPVDDADVYRPSLVSQANRDMPEDDPWARRAALGQSNLPPVQFAPPSTYEPTEGQVASMDIDVSTQVSSMKDTAQTSTSNPSHVISRAPVRFETTKPSGQDSEGDVDMTVDESTMDVAESEGADEAPRSNRPGQIGFAKRLLMKQGWKEGQGLGASGSGMVKPLYVKLDKAKKFSDAAGSGPRKGGTGKIIGGKKAKGVVEEEDPHGKISQVVVLLGLLNGVDVQSEMEADSPLPQRIGEECEKKCGKVERIVCHEATGRIFIKFTNQLSALNAVQRYDGGTLQTLDLINAPGSAAIVRYYDGDDFARGTYDVAIQSVAVEAAP